MRPYEIGIFEEEIIDTPDFVPVHLNPPSGSQNENSNMNSASHNSEGDAGVGSGDPTDRVNPEKFDE